MIGIYDSGLGGLTALKVLRSLLPSEDIIYLGDTARVPYGSRSPETIKKFALECGNFLKSKGVTSLLVACGTVSSNALEEMQKAFDFPITGVIFPASQKAVTSTKNKKIAVLATPATIKSGAYEKAIKAIDKDCEVISKACPLFVPLVENGKKSDSEIVKMVCAEYLSEISKTGADTVILGCTHYPIIADAIKSFFPNAEIISSGAAAAEFVSKSQTVGDKVGKTHYYVTDGVESFISNASLFLGGDVDSDVELVEI